MTGAWKKYAGIFLPLAAVVAAPLLLREEEGGGDAGAEIRLEVITPHNETIRREFGEAFADYWKERTGQKVYVNWRTPGGTSEIKRVLDSAFEAADLRGDEGVGIDVFFGGGEYDFSAQAKLGRFQRARVFDSMSELFANGTIPQTMSGEIYYDAEGLWLGVCLSSFGICYNRDLVRLKEMKPPERWDDLTDSLYFRGVALADPTKSGSVAKAFEMIMQEALAEQIAKGTVGGGRAATREECIAYGWWRGLNRIKMIGANARYFSDSASKVPLDVAQGNAMVGMCIDFYGRTLSEKVKKEEGGSRLQFVTPAGGSSISVDPVAILKGAENLEVAQGFVEFLLTVEAQMIWNARVGETPGPKYRALRRLPIRRDLYTEPYLGTMVDAGVMPYELAARFEYDGSLTGHLFTPLRTIVRAMCIDSNEELKAAWKALVENDFPPEAYAAFLRGEAVSYDRSGGEIRSALKDKDKMVGVRMRRELGEFFRENYREAERLAKEGR